MEFLKITYRFEFENLPAKEYELKFDGKTMSLLNDHPLDVEWAKLDNRKCVHCPWHEKDHPMCPVAQNLEGVASHFSNEKSFLETTIIVTTGERAFVKKASLQEGLQGIFGLIMATSGCPHMDFLRTMARFHMPFSTEIETMVRTTSLYLLKQYFKQRDGLPADFHLKGLEQLYENVTKVNQGIVDRIRGMSRGDADRNALVLLDCYASLLSMEMSGDMGEVRKAVE